MKTALLTACSVCVAALVFAAMPAGSSQQIGCGPIVAVQDPELRAHFSALAAKPSAATTKLCAGLASASSFD